MTNKEYQVLKRFLDRVGKIKLPSEVDEIMAPLLTLKVEHEHKSLVGLVRELRECIDTKIEGGIPADLRKRMGEHG